MASAATSPNAAPLPPLPDLSGAAGTPPLGPQDPMAAIMSGIAPIKSAVDAIQAACQQIVKSGAVPGAEQPCAQIIALSQSLLPMAAQQAMQPGQGAPPLPAQGMQGIPGGPAAPGGPPAGAQ